MLIVKQAAAADTMRISNKNHDYKEPNTHTVHFAKALMRKVMLSNFRVALFKCCLVVPKNSIVLTLNFVYYFFFFNLELAFFDSAFI